LSGCNPIECALEALEDAGLVIHKVGLFTRTWRGECIGEGQFTDALELFDPTPRIKQISLDYKNTEGGTQRRGQVRISLIPKSIFPEKEPLECAAPSKNIEIYYYIDGDLYELVRVEEQLFHWNVLVRKTKKKKLNLENN